MEILVVDDDPVFLDILISILQTFDQNDVTKAASSAEALAVVQSRSTTFDCIFLDIQMPDMDGVSFCRLLRGIPDYRQIPIVMITSHSAKRYVDDAFAAGASDYITKPLDRLELMARIGMVERLVEQRLELMLLKSQASQRNDSCEIQIDFTSAILIPGFDSAIEYLALENYLLTMGKTGMLSASAFAIQIENAAYIFSKASGSRFVDMLCDVGLIISNVIKTDDMLISYAGCGCYVVVLSKEPTTSPDEMSAKLESGLARFADFYISDRLPTPKLRVGASVKSRLFSIASPTRILQRAILLAQQDKSRQLRRWQPAA